ncbi:MAG: ABC transporter ATP-binding protein [Clostridiales bacterium]|nr:ABC transporter ATP-binding protein [Clostridiales bacterium]
MSEKEKLQTNGQSAKLLEVKNLRTTFHTMSGDVQAVRGTSFYVSEGESIGIVGESGCGKSVSMLSILHLLDDNARLEAEEILFDGNDISKFSTKEMRKLNGKEIAMIFQDPMTSLNPVFTIEQQMRDPLMRHLGLNKQQAREKALQMLETVGIPSPESRLKQYPHELSGGLRQRVMIAIAMSCSPKLLIADEPTTALDVTVQAQILDLMKQMKEQYGMAVILISHDLGVISSLCSRVIVMYGGLIVEEGQIDDIFYRTAHPYTAGLLESIPKGDGSRLMPINGTPPDLLNPPVGCPFAARCKYAMKLCAKEMPPAYTLDENHYSCCWLHHPSVKAKRGSVKLV